MAVAPSYGARIGAAVTTPRLARMPVGDIHPGIPAGRGLVLADGRRVALGTPLSIEVCREVWASPLRELEVVVDPQADLFPCTPADEEQASILRGFLRACQGPRPLARHARHAPDGERAAASVDRAIATASWLQPYRQFVLGWGAQDGYLVRAVREALFSGIVAARLGWTDDVLDDVVLAALVSDVGTLLVPPPLRLKPGPWSAAERASWQRHPCQAAELLAPLAALAPTVRAVTLGRHERVDGTGYPEGLAGARVPLTAQVVAAVQRYLGALGGRSYRQGGSPAQALEIIGAESGALADARVCRALLDGVAPYPRGALVRLCDGSGGRVAGGDPLRPRVTVMWRPSGEPADPREVDLAERPDLEISVVVVAD